MKSKVSRLLAFSMFIMLCLTSCGPKIYEVQFELNGGTLVSGESSQLIKAGESAEVPVVERDGYVFAGWDQETDEIREDMVVEALWDELYDITFDANGGEIVEGEEKQQVRAGEMPAAPSAEREYAELIGWEPEVGAADQDTTYVAQWEWRELSSKEIYELISPAVPVIHVNNSDGGESLGSGFFIDDKGTLVTNYHVIDTGISGWVSIEEMEYDILGVKDYDDKKDLAILEIDCTDNPYLNISDKEVSTGEEVYTLGAPLGLDDTFSSGIVSKASREMDNVKFIQTTAPISQGNSGGPLVDVYANVIGINSMTTSEGQNLNFAIAVEELDKLNRESESVETLAEINEKMHPVSQTQSAGDSYVYEIADKSEKEPNDSLMTADVMENSLSYAGAVADDEDMDFYYLPVEESGYFTCAVFSDYDENLDHLSCILFEVTEDDYEIVATLEETDVEGSPVLMAETELESDRLYFLCVTAKGSYRVTEPIYYIAMAGW